MTNTLASQTIPDAGQAPAPQLRTPLDDAAILRAAAELLERPGAWTQGAYSRDEGGRDELAGVFAGGRCSPTGRAVCFCTIGALAKVAGWTYGETEDSELVERLIVAVGDSVHRWNDTPGRTQAEVVATLRAAADGSDLATKTGNSGMPK